MANKLDINEIFSIEYFARQPIWLKIIVFVLSAILTFVVVSFGAFKYFDFSNNYSGQKRTEDNKLDDLAKRLEFKAYADRYQAEIEHVNKLLQEVRRKLPSSLNAGNFIEQLNMNALQAGIDVQKSTPQGSQQIDFYTKFPVKIEGCATYDQIGLFVANLSEIERIITLESFNLGSYLPADKLPRGVQASSTASANCKGKQSFSALIATYQNRAEE